MLRYFKSFTGAIEKIGFSDSVFQVKKPKPEKITICSKLYSVTRPVFAFRSVSYRKDIFDVS